MKHKPKAQILWKNPVFHTFCTGTKKAEKIMYTFGEICARICWRDGCPVFVVHYVRKYTLIYFCSLSTSAIYVFGETGPETRLAGKEDSSCS